MQHVVSGPDPRPNLHNRETTSPSQLALILALVLFAIAGLVTGFSVGVFTRPAKTQQASNQPNISSLPNKSNTAVPTQTVKVLPLGYPVISQISNTIVADGTTSYTLSAHAVDQSIDKGHGKPIAASNITCRIWLTKDSKVTETLLAAQDRLKSVASLTSPLPKEKQGALIFSGSDQTKFCAATGETTWKYQVDPTLTPGTYYLVVLTDWQGQRFNWSWQVITVSKK